MSISALVVDARGILAQQELHHLQVFPVGARTVTQDAGNVYSSVFYVVQIIGTVCETIPVKGCLAEDVLF